MNDGSPNAAIILADFGSTQTKWSLLLQSGNGEHTLHRAATQPSESERPLADGGCEWNPRQFLQRMVRLILDASLEANKLGYIVRGICCTGTTTSTVAIRGRTLVPEIPAIRWDDQRASIEAATLENLRRESNACPWMQVSADSAPARALWLASRFKDLLQPDLVILEQVDLIGQFWTGRLGLSSTIASRKWGFTNRLRWPDQFVRAANGLMGGCLGLMHPQAIVETGTVLGHILPSAVDIYGLAPFTSVIASPYDTVAQVIGLGLLHEENAVAVSFGTSMGVFALVRDSGDNMYTQYGPLPDVPFQGQGLLYDGLRSCASAIDLACAMALGPRGNDDAYFRRISSCLEETQPGSDGVSVLPYFNGGLRSRIGGEPIIRGFNDARRKQFVRAVFEAIGYHIRLIIEGFERAYRIRLGRILAGGGPSQNWDFMQLLANITGRDILVTDYPNAGLLGCAICGATGLKWFDTPESASQTLASHSLKFVPSERDKDRYNQLYDLYCREFLKNEAQLAEA